MVLHPVQQQVTPLYTPIRVVMVFFGFENLLKVQYSMVALCIILLLAVY
jgi:hypothetical protein